MANPTMHKLAGVIGDLWSAPCVKLSGCFAGFAVVPTARGQSFGRLFPKVLFVATLCVLPPTKSSAL